jgi:hypothetical protein
LREKIERRPAKPVRFATVWGVGYRYDTGQIDPSEPLGQLLTHVWHILPVVLIFALPVAVLGGVVLFWLRRGSLASTLTVLVLIPVLATLVGVLGVSGFMFTPALTTMLFVCVLVGLITVPAAIVLGRAIARRSGSGRHTNGNGPRRRRGANWSRGSATICAARSLGSGRWLRRWPTA